MEHLRNELRELEVRKENLHISSEEAKEALEFHLEQLSRRGATLEDSICLLLRRLIEIEEISNRIEEIKKQIG